MMMDFIAKNKIADYIKKDPGAYIPFLICLKSFRYKDVNSPMINYGVGSGGWQYAGYAFEYQTNPWLKTACIMFFGTDEEKKVYSAKKIAKYLAENPDDKIVTTSYTGTSRGKAIPSSKIAPSTIITSENNLHTQHEELFSPFDTTIIDNDLVYTTRAGYLKALNRAISIFEAKPETSEVEELALLLPSIKNYERNNIVLPKFNALEAIKHKLKSYDDIMPGYLTSTLGSPEKLELLLSGKKLPSDKMLAKVYKKLRLDFPVNRDDFITE